MNIDVKHTGLEDFFAGIDGLVMGRNTYDFVFDYGSWPYHRRLCDIRRSVPRLI